MCDEKIRIAMDLGGATMTMLRVDRRERNFVIKHACVFLFVNDTDKNTISLFRTRQIRQNNSQTVLGL